LQLEIKIIDNLSGLIENQKAWKGLFETIKSSDFYLHPYWHISWWKSFGKGKKMHVIFLLNTEKVVGIFPLAFYRGSLKEAKLRILGFSGGTQTDRSNFLLHPDYRNVGVRFFQNEFENLLKKVDISFLHSVPQDSWLFDNDFFKDKIVHSKKYSLPFLNLANLSFEQLQKTWKASHRGDIRRQTRRLEELGELSLTVYSDKEAVNNLLSKFLDMHSSRWGYKFDEKYYKILNFYSGLINRFQDEETIHFSALQLNKIPISYHFGFVHKNRFLYYKPAYDIEYQNYSPGKVHIAKLLGLGIQLKWEVFDFLLGDESYKRNWVNNTDFSFSYHIKGGGILGKFGIWWFGKGLSFFKTLKSISKK
jgi:CelD/BcsL family acetyltransferase involved in cellulose biosynthesis